ncbi:hypothetical protein KSP40_PGU002655 [Platanthera guangdongensis]|uniref:Uncharacterized protein n=1 Tax=Platanthera guangdongensis TaxID=2320717 RepID=A0ABR2N5S6_9ASPA
MIADTIPLILVLLLPLQTKSKHDFLMKNFSSQIGIVGDITAFGSNTLSNTVIELNLEVSALPMQKMRNMKNRDEKSWRNEDLLCLHTRMQFFSSRPMYCWTKGRNPLCRSMLGEFQGTLTTRWG